MVSVARALALLLCLATTVAQAGIDSLRYQVVYQGLFSAGGRMPIADVSLQTRVPAEKSGYREAEMQVTSKAYPTVEAFYPIRYRFRSWYLADHSSALAAEYYEENKRSGKRHRLILLDDPAEPFVVHNLLDEGLMALPSLRAGQYPAGSREQGGPQRFDRLGLLQSVRALALEPGEVFNSSVTNGKKLFDYRASVETREAIDVAGRQWDAVKVRFDGLEQPQEGQQRHAHRPVFVWFSADSRHLPLRAVSRHALGRFTIELTESAEQPRLAQVDVP